MKNLIFQSDDRYEGSFSKKKNSSILQTQNGIGSGQHYFQGMSKNQENWKGRRMSKNNNSNLTYSNREN